MRISNPSDNEQTSQSAAWKRSLVAGASACLIVFLINLSITIWSITLPEGSQNGTQTGRRILYEGSCSTSSTLSVVLHLIINIFSSILLGASNYVRFNSVIFSSLTTHNYRIYTIDDRLQLPEFYNSSNKDENPIWGMIERAEAGVLDNLTALECIDEYATAFQTSRSHVLLISDPGSKPDGSDIYNMDWADLSTDWLYSCPPPVYEWICPSATCSQTCRSLLPEVKSRSNDWRPYGYRVKYCLSQPERQTCRLNFSVHIAAIILAVNAFKAAILAYTVFRPPTEPLFTLGDAIQSFMAFPDVSSRGSCLASVDHVRKGSEWAKPRVMSAKRRRWAVAVSRRRWGFSLLMYCVAFAVSLFFLSWGIKALVGPRDITSIWNLGFGAVSETALITGLEWQDGADQGLIWTVIISNLA
ncbi:hypothetical protein FOPG_18505 [Fusarium oxysporum f. sp. conglutinans race 2 54008]|uniref:DUF6536 domain-containing protein n=1 Tax=Fusarium oxysporum f. sp. conglutinans race 2 54008 TaxID=1089457 RepID=X0GZJ7_FUSOX|nr:hypothetical protein FOPG_18505 [Fusarium oxysporum f. sp. conglutinans race 2 54008]